MINDNLTLTIIQNLFILDFLTSLKESILYKIQKVSHYFCLIFTVLIFAIPFLIVGLWIFIDTAFIKNLLEQGFFYMPILTPEGSINLSTVNWSLFTKMIGLIAQAVNFLPFFLSLFILRSIFANYQKGKIFNAINANHYKYLGWLFFLNALITEPLYNLLMILSVTFANPPGHRYILSLIHI